jgi:hypothetical protein
MAITTIASSATSNGSGEVIDLRGHRLGDLVQVLSGCTAEHAELAVGEHLPGTAVSPEAALDTVARALIGLRSAEPDCTAG